MTRIIVLTIISIMAVINLAFLLAMWSVHPVCPTGKAPVYKWRT